MKDPLKRLYIISQIPDSQRIFILWESDHLSSGNRDILRESGHGKRDTLSSGKRDTYPLGNILWESGIWAMD